MDTLHPLLIQCVCGINKKQHIHKLSRCAITNSSLDRRFLLRVAAAVMVAAITGSVHFAVDKLGELDDEVLVLARSKREVENALHVDRFYEHLHECAKQCRYVINSPCARRKG
jgi:hypothetical protein